MARLRAEHLRRNPPLRRGWEPTQWRYLPEGLLLAELLLLAERLLRL